MGICLGGLSIGRLRQVVVWTGLTVSNDATKGDLKNATGVDISKSAKNVDIDKLEKVPTSLKSLKSKLDKLDFGKFEITLADLSKLSNVVKNDVIKKTEYDELVKKANTIRTTDTTDLVLKNWLPQVHYYIKI